jgi:hypothetical protein
LLLTQPTQNRDQGRNPQDIQLFILWLIGIALIITWILKERSDLLKISMVFLVLGQIMLWVLIWEPGNQNTYDSLTINQIGFIIIILWTISGILVLIKKKKRTNMPKGNGFQITSKEKFYRNKNTNALIVKHI